MRLVFFLLVIGLNFSIGYGMQKVQEKIFATTRMLAINEVKEDKCTICYGNLDDLQLRNHVVEITACKHQLHRECFKQLSDSAVSKTYVKCPLCSVKVVPLRSYKGLCLYYRHVYKDVINDVVRVLVIAQAMVFLVLVPTCLFYPMLVDGLFVEATHANDISLQ